MNANPHLWWYVARATGLVAWGLAAGAVIAGLLVAGRPARRIRPAWSVDLHRFLGGLTIVFVGVHLAGLAADRYVQFGLRELLVPFASRWRPAAVAWGVAALYLLVAVEATSLLRRHLPRRVWRSVHAASYPLYVAATAHLFAAGTDAGGWFVQWLALAASTVVVFLTGFRVLARHPRRMAATAIAGPGRRAAVRTPSPSLR